MSVDGTLTAIDGALADWGTSKDAMRWQPEPGRVICDGGRPLMPRARPPFPGGVIPGFTSDSDLIPVILEPGTAFVPAALMVSFQVDVGPFIEQMNRLGRMITRTLGPALERIMDPVCQMAHTVDAVYYPRKHIRCRRCNPAGNPRPLTVSGATYRRRQQARKRRR